MSYNSDNRRGNAKRLAEYSADGKIERVVYKPTRRGYEAAYAYRTGRSAGKAEVHSRHSYNGQELKYRVSYVELRLEYGEG